MKKTKIENTENIYIGYTGGTKTSLIDISPDIASSFAVPTDLNTISETFNNYVNQVTSNITTNIDDFESTLINFQNKFNETSIALKNNILELTRKNKICFI
jgi:hypothetical protein